MIRDSDEWGLIKVVEKVRDKVFNLKSWWISVRSCSYRGSLGLGATYVIRENELVDFLQRWLWIGWKIDKVITIFFWLQKFLTFDRLFMPNYPQYMMQLALNASPRQNSGTTQRVNWSRQPGNNTSFYPFSNELLNTFSKILLISFWNILVLYAHRFANEMLQRFFLIISTIQRFSFAA